MSRRLAVLTKDRALDGGAPLTEFRTQPTTLKAGRRGALDAGSLIRSASWMSAAHGAAQLSAYGSLLYLAHLIPPKEFGAVATGTAILNIGVVLMDSGTRGSIVVAPALSQRFLRLSLMRCVGVGLLLSVAVGLSSHVLGRVFGGGSGGGSVIALLGLAIPLYALAVVPMALLQRSMHFRSLAWAWASSNASSAVVAVVAGALGAGVWALVVRQLAWCAVLAVLSLVIASRRVRGRDPAPAGKQNPLAHWFLLFAVTQVVTFNLDYLVIGHQSSASQLGLYAVAFMIAFAPLQHFSAEVGRVLFAAAAASGAAQNGARTVVATRLMALLLLPTIPLAIVLAPLVLPAVLGSRWSGMVVPFELLVVAGVGYSIVNCIGEALSGSGHMPFRAKFNVLWGLVTLAALIVLVHVDGIRGAALAHVLVFCGYAAVFTTSGMRRLGSDGRQLWRALRPVIGCVAVQAAVCFGVEAGLRGADVARWPSALTGAFLGLVSLVVLATRGQKAPLREAVSFARMAWGRSGA